MSSDTPDSPLPLSSNETIPEATRHPNPLYKLLHPGIGHIGRRITGYLGSEGQMNATIASRFLQDLVKPHIPNLNVIKESKKEEDAAHYFCRLLIKNYQSKQYIGLSDIAGGKLMSLAEGRNSLDEVEWLAQVHFEVNDLTNWLHLASCLEGRAHRQLKKLSIGFQQLGSHPMSQSYADCFQLKLPTPLRSLFSRVRRFELYSRSGSIATPTISQVLDSLTDLRELVLDLPGMDDHLYKILADQYRHLTQLSFGSRVCNISLLFPPQKRTFVNLVGLSLNIGHEWHHYRHLGDILSSDLPMLRDLDLSFVALDDDFDDLYFFPDEKFHALCDFFNQTWDRLRSLALRACPFAYFANPPSKHCYPNLREVTFQDCEDFWFICSKFINECPNISPSDCVWDDYITIMDRFPNLRELRVGYGSECDFEQLVEMFPRIQFNGPILRY
ncbi:hypothetical protein BJ085DRAFT_27542 [Dimargaris cristalligena]|uniref:F-box domain-containing protein n=1 Tax=Dimargaris cristalligena TaxID=215637 RepID=A0A4V1J5L1_9FUNG|nr:hypothetical protein BJ085DRAFT_27542 [Dimargaris cristalligena]|eukprot:RKP39439.1 hypothetical protein BJ085DRAFT_27542 [Dimargaris cristalligena]